MGEWREKGRERIQRTFMAGIFEKKRKETEKYLIKENIILI